MAARTPSIHVFLGRPLFLLSPGIHSIINFDSLSSCILLTWPYHWSLFLSMMSTMSGFSFATIISFICSFFILSILTNTKIILFIVYDGGSSKFTRQTMHEKRNTEARSLNNYCCGKAINIQYYDYGYSCLIHPACKAHAPYYIVVSVLSGFTIFSLQIFGKHSNTKFNENPSSGSRVVPWGQTNDQTGQT